MKGCTPTQAEKKYWNALVEYVGCIACRLDGHENHYVSIHHIDGRVKHKAHCQVLPLCAGHHQDGTGYDKTLVAVHPFKARFEALYGPQKEMKAHCDAILRELCIWPPDCG